MVFCKGTLEEALKEEKHILKDDEDSDEEDELEESDADKGNDAREGNDACEGNGTHEVNAGKDVKTPIKRKRRPVCVWICVSIRLSCCQCRNR